MAEIKGLFRLSAKKVRIWSFAVRFGEQYSAMPPVSSLRAIALPVTPAEGSRRESWNSHVRSEYLRRRMRLVAP